MASDKMKAHYDHLGNSAGFQVGDQDRLYHLIYTQGKSLKL
jgi:hypothetical protein